MIQIKDLKETVETKIKSREVKHTPFEAVIVSVHGSVHPANRPDYVWIAESNQPESRHPVFNNAVAPVEGLPVWVRKSPNPPHQLEIDRVYFSATDPGNSVGGYSLPNHAPNHQYPSETNIGIDPVLIYQPALQMFKTTGNGANLTVYTRPYIYHVLGVRQEFTGLFTDMTPYLPSVGNAVRVLIYLDLDTGTLGYVSGTEVTIGDPVPYPNIPTTNAVPSVYVLLEDGQTYISTAEHIVDSRDLWGAGGASGLPATQIGQIGFSVDGVVLSAQLPLVGVNGIMVSSDGLIMIV